MNVTRRQFLKASTAFAGLNILPSGLWSNSPNSRYCTAHIGVGDMGEWDLKKIGDHKMTQVVGICDVNSPTLEKFKSMYEDKDKARLKYKDTAFFADYREMFQSMGDKIDAVSVSTPDHTHHPATLMAMKLGKNVYSQKPLTHEISEALELMDLADKKKLVTQMGIQVHSSTEYRMATRFIQEGIIGKVSRVYSWSYKTWGDDDKSNYIGSDPIPEGLSWDLWLGTAPSRPFLKDRYHPGNWRKVLDFGCGTLGDMGVHIMDTPYKALALSHPKTVNVSCREPNGVSHPMANIIEYEFPGTQYTTDTLKFSWHDGASFSELKDNPDLKLEKGKKLPNQGVMFIGEDGNRMLLPHVAGPQPLPRKLLAKVDRSQVKPVDHYDQWVDACLGKGKCSAGFDYAGFLTVGVLLGVVGNRFPGQTLEWDGASQSFKGNEEATKLVSRKQRVDY